MEKVYILLSESISLVKSSFKHQKKWLHITPEALQVFNKFVYHLR